MYTQPTCAVLHGAAVHSAQRALPSTCACCCFCQDDWGSKGAGRACTAAGGLKCSTGGTHGRHLAYHVAPFGSEASRSSPAAAAAATATTAVGAVSPGPGAYDAPVDLKQVFRPLSVPGVNRAGFSASGRRFCSSATVSPGPGAYAADSASSCSLVRPSFNVTLD